MTSLMGFRIIRLYMCHDSYGYFCFYFHTKTSKGAGTLTLHDDVQDAVT